MLSNELVGLIDYRNYSCNKMYKSKRNKVYSIENNRGIDEFVVKEYMSKDGKGKDILYLKLLADLSINVPQLIFEGSNFVVMEKLEDNTLLDEIVKYEGLRINPKGEEIEDIFKGVFKWLHSFYQIVYDSLGKRLIYGDTNFRNFIVCDKIYAVDFEDVKEGSPIEDMGRICAHLLKYTPEMTPWKIEVCDFLVEILVGNYDYKEETLKQEINRQLEIIDNRRHLKDSSQ